MAPHNEAHALVVEREIGQRFKTDDGSLRDPAIRRRRRRHGAVLAGEIIGVLVPERLADKTFRRNRRLVPARTVTSDGDLLRQIETA
jgi:hypothetical protein